MTLKTDYVLDRLLEAERHISDAEKVLWSLEGQVKDFNALTITLLASNVGADWREKLAKIRERLEKEKERLQPFWMPLDDRPVSPPKADLCPNCGAGMWDVRPQQKTRRCANCGHIDDHYEPTAAELNSF